MCLAKRQGSKTPEERNQFKASKIENIYLIFMLVVSISIKTKNFKPLYNMRNFFKGDQL